MLALAALQRRKSTTISDGELRRRLQEIDFADSYMYVIKIHTLVTGAVDSSGAQVETVFYGESDATGSLLTGAGRWGGLPAGADNVRSLTGTIKTPGAMVSARPVHSGRATESWLNTIVKFGMYLSRPTSFDEMKDPQNCISKYAILNNSIPRDRTDNSYEMREPPAGFYTFESSARQLPDVVSNMISDYLPGPVGVKNVCPPLYGGRGPVSGGAGRGGEQYRMWLQYAGESNFEMVIKKLEGVPFPNGACWAPLPELRRSQINDYIRFPRGGVNRVGMTNIRDYTRGGGSGVNDNDSEANPPLIWDKCCAQSCYKPCSDTEEEDGCVTGTWPATFFPRFKFTHVEVATSLGLKRAYFSEHIVKLIKNMKANHEVYLANITCDPYFLQALRQLNIFKDLWADRRSGSVPLSYTRDFQSPSGNTLLRMISTVVNLMECKTYTVAYRVARSPSTPSPPSTSDEEDWDEIDSWGAEYLPGIRDRNQVFVSVYKAVSGTDEAQVMQKQGTFGPFRVYQRKIKDDGSGIETPARDRLGRAIGTVVLDSNDMFGDGDNDLQSKRKYFIHEGIQIAPSITLAELRNQYNQLTSKAMPVSHPCTIVGFKCSGVTYVLQEPKAAKNQDNKVYLQRTARFTEEQLSSQYENINYFILDMGLSSLAKSANTSRGPNYQGEFLHNAYMLMPMPSEYDSILSVFSSHRSDSETNFFDWLKRFFSADEINPRTGFPIQKFYKSIFTFFEFDPERPAKPAYSCSAITSIIRAKLNVDGGPTSGQAVEETDTGGGQADLQPSQAIADGSDPVWPLFLAVALCIGVILLRKMMGRKK
jgi:hypothetical protein